LHGELLLLAFSFDKLTQDWGKKVIKVYNHANPKSRRKSLPDLQDSVQKIRYEILHVTPFFPPDIGGISTHVFNLRENLCNMGNKIAIVSATRLLGHEPLQFEDGIIRMKSVYLLGWPYPTLRSVSIPIDLGYKMDNIIQKRQYDLIHVHDPHFPLSWLAIIKAHKYNIPSILTFHAMYALNPKRLGGESLIETWFNRFILKKMLIKTDAVIGLTNQITNYARTYGESSTKYYTIPNGVNCDVYRENIGRKREFRYKYDLSADSIIILFCGRLEHVKGILEFAAAIVFLMKTFNRHIEVVIVGDGTLRAEVQRILGNVKNVHILPWQPQSNLHEIYIASDIFVNPSNFEGLPITILEAMNALLHIVYTPVGGVEEILKPYSMKTVLKNNTPEEIYKVLSSLTSRNFNEGNLDQLSIYAHTFDWKNVALATKSVYDTLTNKVP
jgi:glycosyltransferase involved in cell wall biosynthesis